MIIGVLSAHAKGLFFDDVMAKLQTISRTEVDHSSGSENLQLPQVHALNCLKDIFTDTRLGSGADSHIEDCLSIAVNYLDHDL